MPWRIVCGFWPYAYAALTDVNLAEIIVRACNQRSLYAGLSLMAWILKREVRAFGECLGMYRR